MHEGRSFGGLLALRLFLLKRVVVRRMSEHLRHVGNRWLGVGDRKLPLGRLIALPVDAGVGS